MKQYNREVGSRLFDSRKAKKMSRAELGGMIGLHESTIKRYEDGQIKSLDIDKIKEFARYLEVTPQWLMGWDDDEINMTLSDREACLIDSYRETTSCKQHAINKYLGIWDNPHPEEEENFDVTLVEISQKYLTLDKYGKEMVDMVLDKEYRRCSAMESSNTSHLTPIAAHNDDADDEEQQRLMQQDIDEL